MQFMRQFRDAAAILVRIAVSFVFLWFGLNQLFDTASFIQWVPSLAYQLPFSVTTLVILNGAFETLFGLLLFLGVLVRPVAFLLSLHLVGIAFSVGYGDVFVRDVGLAAATFSVFLRGPDKFCAFRKAPQAIKRSEVE